MKRLILILVMSVAFLGTAISAPPWKKKITDEKLLKHTAIIVECISEVFNIQKHETVETAVFKFGKLVANNKGDYDQEVFINCFRRKDK
jgi:hypothetical protein